MKIFKQNECYAPGVIFTTWDDREDYWSCNDGWGACNTGWGQQPGNTFKDRGFSIVCKLGGIGCNVDHTRMKIRNLENKIDKIINN